MDEPLECIDGPEGCGGDVEYRTTPDRSDFKAFLRCEVHFAERLERAERNMTEYPDSDLAPAWFDPANAGETWESDG
jgi:hypothetical protein